MNGPRAVRVPQVELVGEELPGWDLRLLLPTILLVVIGVAMVFSAAIPIATRGSTRNVYIYLEKEAAFVFLGMLALIGAARLSLPRLQDRALPLLAGAVVLLLGVHVLGKEINGARSWYALPVPGLDLRFQPSELAKLVLVVVLARYFTKFPQGLRSFGQMIPPLLMLGAVCLPILKEPDMGTTAVIGLSMMIFFHIAGAKFRYLLVIAAFGGLAVAYKIHHEPYQLLRIMDWINPQPGSEMAGNYQISRSLIAMGSGGIFGRGYTAGVEKFYYLPESTTDAILAVIGEELGVVATWLVVGLFGYLVWRGLQIAREAEDRFCGLVAVGVTCLFGVQALMNIAVITGAAPTTGITLPFVSYGGSSLLFSLAGIGLLLNIARGKRKPRTRQAQG